MKRRFLSTLMALSLALSLLPTAAFAAEGDEDAPDTSAGIATQAGAGLPDPVNGVITLTENVTLTDLWRITQDTVLDLNGKTLTLSANIGIVVDGDVTFTVRDSTAATVPQISSDGSYAVTYVSGVIDSENSAIQVQNGASFILYSGKIQSTTGNGVNILGETNPSNSASINSSATINGGFISAQEYGIGVYGRTAVLDVTNGVIEARDNAAVAGNGSRESNYTPEGYIINIDGGTLIGRITTGGFASCGIYHPNAGTVNVSGGTIISTKGAGIVARAGQTNITGGEILALGDSSLTGKVGDSRVVVTTSGVVLDLAANYGGAQITDGKATNADVNISGTAVISGSSKAVDVIETHDGTTVTESDNVVITGGTFQNSSDNSKSEILQDYFPTGAALTQNERGVIIADETADVVASVDGVGYTSLQAAINAANDGDTVTLLQSITLEAPGGLSAGQGVITIEKDIILDGNNNTITAGDGFAWNTTSNRGEYHVINIQDGADVTIRDLTIDGGKTSTSGARSGINIFTNAGETAPTVLLENVHVQNCSTYGVTVGGGSLTANDLTTSGNTWGGVNVDTKNNTKSSFTMNSGLIGEANSVYFENGSNAVVTGKINGGTFAGDVSVADQEGTTSDVTGVTLTISGGTFQNDVSAYLASGLEWDPSTGAVYTPSQGGSSSGSSSTTYSPTLDVSDGGSIKVSPRTPEAGDEVTITPDPDSGYEVDEVLVTDRDGDEIRVTANRDGTYTFTQPRGRVTIEVTFVRETGETTFSDVPETYWAYDEIEWAYDNGYVNGTSASTFAPGASISRQQVWMILARLSGGSPADMAAAREWAMANDISDGTNPGNAVTRQQLAALLFRFAQANGYDSGDRAALTGFPDAGSVASYAVEALQWATASGILNGTSQGTLNPAGTATRAQFAVMLYRFWNGL